MSRFGLYVKFTSRPGQRDALVEQLLSAAKLAAASAGCELYIVNTSPADEETVWVTEVWRSRADHDASLTHEGARELIQRALPLLAGRPESIELVPVGGKGLSTV